MKSDVCKNILLVPFTFDKLKRFLDADISIGKLILFNKTVNIHRDFQHVLLKFSVFFKRTCVRRFINTHISVAVIEKYF